MKAKKQTKKRTTKKAVSKSKKRIIRKKAGPDITLARFKEAIEKTGGTYLHIANKLGVDSGTVAHYISRNNLGDLIQQAKRDAVDSAQNKLLLAVDRNEKWAIEKVLDSWGRDRGFGKEPLVQVNNNTQNNDNRSVNFSEIYAEKFPELIERFKKRDK